MNLGLDLQGGSQLLLQVNFPHYLKDQLEITLDDIRRALRTERVGYTNIRMKPDEASIQKISFELLKAEDAEKAKSQIHSINYDLTVDLNGKIVSLYYDDSALKKLQRSVLEKSIEIVRRRVDETGTREPIIQMQGADKILLQVPGLANPDQLKSLLGKTAKMTFHLMDESDPYASRTSRARMDEMLLPDVDPKSNRKYLVKKKVELDGEMLVDSQPAFEQGQPVVSFKFNNVGGKKFAKVTSENVGKPFAIVLDGKVITAPRINGAILGGSGIITGSFSTKEVTETSLLLRSGALPAPLDVIEERSVGPSLGQDSIDSGIYAAALGTAFILLIMVGIYKLFGLFSCFALFFNVSMIFAVLSLLGATLTMPGIAGMVLTMGMAVDANVLIFERIKEELRLGRTPIAAIDAGFNRAFSTIIDSNLTTLISTFFLYTYGSGPIKGFAVTLTAGIICSVFSAISLTKAMIIVYVKARKPKKLFI